MRPSAASSPSAKGVRAGLRAVLLAVATVVLLVSGPLAAVASPGPEDCASQVSRALDDVGRIDDHNARGSGVDRTDAAAVGAYNAEATALDQRRDADVAALEQCEAGLATTPSPSAPAGPAPAAPAPAAAPAAAVPQGVSPEAFARAGAILRRELGGFSDDIAVHGSRARGDAGPDSDLDVAVRVPPIAFEAFARSVARFANANPGSALDGTRLNALRNGIIQAGEARWSRVRVELEQALGMKVDLSMIQIGGAFDRGPYIPVPRG